MAHETSIRLPVRLMGIVAGEQGAAPVNALSLPPPPPGPTEAELQAQAERMQIQHVLAELGQASRQMQVATKKATEQIRAAAIDLSLAVASRFLMEQVQRGTFPFERVIDQALEQLAPRLTASVALHPEDLALLQARLPEERLSCHAAELRWIADPTLPRGSCRMETPDRAALFDMEARLRQLREVLIQWPTDAAA